MIELSLSPLGCSDDLVVISFVRFVDLADLLVLPPVSVLVTSAFVIVTPFVVVVLCMLVYGLFVSPVFSLAVFV